MAKLDSLKVQRLLSASKAVMAPDGDGLYLRIRDTGGASWTLRYRYGGRDVWYPLGNAANMSLKTARKEKRAARVLIDQGKDPLAEKRRAKEAAARRGPFADLAERWYSSEIEPRYRHPGAVRRALDKHILPKLGRRKAEEITPAHCSALLDGVRNSHPALANDLLRYLKAIFAFGRRRRVLQVSPVGDFTARLDAGGKEAKRDRALTRDEIAALLKATRETAEFGGNNALAVKLLLALCVRKGELLGAKWTEFDLNPKAEQGPVWRLPAGRSKSGSAISIPLAPVVVEWLSALQTLAAGSEYVFPARRRDRRSRHKHVGIDTLNAAMSRLTLTGEPFTIHDLRRTARTQLAELGVRSEIAERCLNHAIKGVEGTYNRHDYFEERRDALKQWVAVLQELEQGSKLVVPIGRRAATGR